MANSTITVFEHTTLFVDEHEFTDANFKALVKYNDLHKRKYFSVGYNKITFKSYVGVIQVGNKVIEVLPKADNVQPEQAGNKDKWKSVLLFMLQQAGYIKINEMGKAAQSLQNSNLLDLYIYTFLKETAYLIHTGLVKKYRINRQNQTSLKGRLLIEKQIKHNYIHKERFFTEHTVYNKNNRFNAILKKALIILQRNSVNSIIKREAANQLLSFESVDCWEGNLADLNKLIFDRKTRSYAYAIEIARMIILNYCPDVSSGNKSILAILFDMNRLYEKFVYKALKREEERLIEHKLSINGKDRQLFWNGRTLIPDIIVDFEKEKEGKKQPGKIIIDTKWKVLKNSNPADEDLKQMFAYNIQFGATHSILLYPYTGIKGMGKVHFEPGKHFYDLTHFCEVCFADLFDNVGNYNRSFAADFINTLLELQRYIPMLLFRQFGHFVLQHGKCFNQLCAGIFWFYHFINKPSFGCQVWCGKLLCILRFLLGQFLGRVSGFGNFFLKNDLTGALGAHYSNFCRRPGIVDVGANVF